MYTLTITEQEADTIAFVGGRYAWSEALGSLGVGTHDIPEHEAWGISEAFETDTEGGHSMFPMLDHRSPLAEKLFSFFEGII